MGWNTAVLNQNRPTHWTTFGLIGGITAVFLGYLSVWIPGPAAGLQFIGVEVGEWLKFLGVGPIRNVFYLPPVTLGSIMVLFSTGWSSRRWQSWLWRWLGVAIALLAFPALEDLMGTNQAEYLTRIWWITAVIIIAVIVTLLSYQPTKSRLSITAYLLGAAGGIVGALFPMWLYHDIQPTLSLIMGEPIGVGLGLWLNGVGHLALTVVALYKLSKV